MRLFKGILFAGLAAVLSMVSTGTAQAAIIPVYSDSGALGSFTLKNLGVVGAGVGAVSTLELTLTTPAAEHVETINGITVTIPASFSSPMLFTMTNLGGGTYSVVSDFFTKLFHGEGGNDAALHYNITAADAPVVLSNFLNLKGQVFASDPTLAWGGNIYDFSLFTGPGCVNNLTLTGTTFTGTTSINGLIATAGSQVIGSGSFSQLVPEPSSMALLAIGGAAAFGISRRRKAQASA